MAALIGFALLLAVPTLAIAANPSYPGSPNESPRLNTPDDAEFDPCEADDEQSTDTSPCQTYAEEQYGAFGFSPDSANATPTSGGLHYATGTRYADCSQLDPNGKRANRDAEAADTVLPGSEALAECLQISGVRADLAQKFSTGDPEVAVAILDTGIRWQSSELVNKVRLNTRELPKPDVDRPNPVDRPSGSCDGYTEVYDANTDGAVNVRDYACDQRVEIDAGDTESDGILDASDLIATFSAGSFSEDGKAGGTDDDDNGYVDDIAGWDFFDDDNDPYDASSCCSANGHGSGRADEAVAETNNAAGDIGMCPDCQLVPLRVWDTFVVPTDNFAMGVIYAADNGASVVEGAVGGLTNTQFARTAFGYADSKGVALTLVSSDINSANHNYPTNYNEAIYVGGSIYDTAPNNTCSGPGGLPGVPDVLPSPPDNFEEGCADFLGRVNNSQFPVSIPAPNLQPPTTSFFRNSNLTQYGGKADIVLMGSTGSENTGQASGAAGLLMSFGRKTFNNDNPLSGNEVRQLLTMSAEDVLPANTGQIGAPDKANAGWDPHFGYGRVNLDGAVRRIANDRGAAPEKGSGEPGSWPCADPPADATCVPPEAQLNAPDWFTPINIDRVPAEGIAVEGFADAPHSDDGVGNWELEYACGQDALDTDFEPISGSGIPESGISGNGPIDGELGKLPKSMLADLADTCDGQVELDAGRPAGGADDGPWPADPYPGPDPERHAFQIRFTVHEQGNQKNFGRYRKTLFAYNDDGNLDGFPKPIGSGAQPGKLVTASGGEVSPRLYDIDGDNALDLVQGTSSGELYVLDSEGEPLKSFNGGDPVHTQRYAAELKHPVPGAVQTPYESLRVPAIGDIDGDREPEIVASAGEHVYAWEADGTEVEGFPVRIDPELSEPCVDGVQKPCFNAADRAITGDNHIKRGIFGSVALADLDDDGNLDIVSGSMDQHVYAWDGEGELLDDAAFPGPDNGFPRKLQSEDADGAEIVASPAIAQLDGDGPPEIVIATNEVIAGQQEFPNDFYSFFGAALRAATGSNPVYAINADGTDVGGGWPYKVPVAAGDLLPLVLPSHDAAVLDVEEDGDDEVSVSAGTGVVGAVSVATAGAGLVQGDGNTFTPYTSAAGNLTDNSAILNLADYPSIGDLTGTGTPYVLKGGLTANGAANLLAVNQNLPFNHVEQAFDPATGTAVAGYPIATDDFQLLSQAAVARVGGDGPQTQALVGTGLYQLHAYGPDGADAPGWPKFTGGWTQTTPAVGDATGDGDLEVTVTTREGWTFLWETGVDACDGSNEEWQSFHHDEFGSANYGTDARPPGTPTDLVAERAADGTIKLSFTAPGDDWLCGTAEKIQILKAGSEIGSPDDGTVVRTDDAVAAGGEGTMAQVSSAELGNASHLAVLYRDEAGNWGRLASVKVPAAPTGPGGGDGGGDGSNPGDGGGGNPGDGGGGSGSGRDPFAPARCETSLLSADFSRAGSDDGETINGTPGDDVLNGNGGRDTVVGLAGDDCLTGNGARDTIRGKSGADVGLGGRGGDFIKGNAGDDVLEGGPGRDRLRSAGGEDVVRGQGGSDNLSSGNADDRISGGPGDDRLFGNEGNDVIRGGKGDDVLFGGGGKRNLLAGGPGKDRCIVAKRQKNKTRNCERVLVGGARG